MKPKTDDNKVISKIRFEKLIKRIKQDFKNDSFKDKLGKFTYDTIRTDNAYQSIDERCSELKWKKDETKNRRG